MTWTKEELRKVAESNDLHNSRFRDDSVTYGTSTWIWSVVAGDAGYARGCNGQAPRWYQAAVQQKAGRITAAGMTKEATFKPIDGPINDLVTKPTGPGTPRVPTCGRRSDRACAATVQIVPWDTNSKSTDLTI